MSSFWPILAIDTAAQQCAVAVLGDGIAYEGIEPQAQGQSQRLLPMIQDLLQKAGLGFADLKAIAVTTGPGSFTGLRVGLAAAHGMALALDIPAIGIDSFSAFATSLPRGDQELAVIVESRRAELYWCLLTSSGGQIGSPANSLPGEIAAYLADRPDILLCGDGAAHLCDLLPHHQIMDQSPGPSALAIARLGVTRLSQEIPQTLPQALYIRPPDAKPARA